MEEKTKVEQLYEIAAWAKKQNPEFTKNFKTMAHIIKFYSKLPADYDRKKSIVEYVHRGLRSDSYSQKRKAEKLSLIVNTLFEFRYFKKAPKKWNLRLGIRRWKSSGPNAVEHIEVSCVPYDKCNFYNDFEPSSFGAHSIPISTLGDAKRAAEQLLESVKKNKGDDYEVEYGSHLKEAIKKSLPTNEELSEQISIKF